MNKQIIHAVIIFTILFGSLFISTTEIQPVAATGTTWTVDDDGPADFSTIQEAVNAASDGDTIFVHSGNYYESVSIAGKKDLTLQGENKENTIICGAVYPNGLLMGIYVGESSVVIDGFTLLDFVYGVYICNWGENKNLVAEVSNNLIACCNIGISYGNSSYFSIISDNLLAYNNEGIRVGMFSYNNTITRNSVIYNDLGISVDHSSNNTIYNNYFVNNINQTEIHGGTYYALTDESVNEWDLGYSSGGNYWDDYTGVDNNADGIGDTPYIINELNQDNYPLMNPLPDLDLDGIYDDVDEDITWYSNIFTDLGNGGVSTGEIITRGDQQITIMDEPDTAEENFGLRIITAPTGGESPALIDMGENSTIQIGPGADIIVTYGSVHIKVITGTVQATFVADDGTTAVAELVEGNNLAVEPTTLTITNEGETEAVVILGDLVYSIPAGAEVKFTATLDILPRTLNLESNGKTITAYVELPIPYHVNQIDIDSIKLTVKTNEFSPDLTVTPTIYDYDGDGTDDLMIHFLRQELVSSLRIADYLIDTGIDDAILFTVSGNLYDDTPFKCSTTVNVLCPGH